jgi:hypothetical protein
MSNSNERTYNVHIVVRPAADLPGKWMAHCLDVDVVTYGDSLRHVLDMIREAVEETFRDDAIDGRESLERRAPKQCWDELWKVLFPHTVATPLSELLEHERRVRYVIVNGTVTVTRETARSDTSDSLEIEPVGLSPAEMSCHM